MDPNLEVKCRELVQKWRHQEETIADQLDALFNASKGMILNGENTFKERVAINNEVTLQGEHTRAEIRADITEQGERTRAKIRNEATEQGELDRAEIRTEVTEQGERTREEIRTGATEQGERTRAEIAATRREVYRVTEKVDELCQVKCKSD
jgi:hypothetical protein